MTSVKELNSFSCQVSSAFFTGGMHHVCQRTDARGGVGESGTIPERREEERVKVEIEEERDTMESSLQEELKRRRKKGVWRDWRDWEWGESNKSQEESTHDKLENRHGGVKG